MGFRKCQYEDPFTSRVRTVYRASVVQAPRGGIDTFDILAVKKRRVESRGEISSIIAGADEVELPAITSVPAAEMRGVRSATVNAEIGVSLTSAFLSALGIPVPGADLKASLWKGVSSFAFEVRDVRQRQIDVSLMGKTLTGRKVDRESPAVGIFFLDDKVQLLVITRTLTSSHFAVRMTRAGGQSGQIDVDAIADLVGQASTKASWKREADDMVSFRGVKPATFAFAAVPCLIQDDGRFLFGLERDDLKMGVEPRGAPRTPRPIVEEDGLIVLDDLTASEI